MIEMIPQEFFDELADRPWHIGKTRGELSVSVDDNGHITMTTVSGQTRTVISAAIGWRAMSRNGLWRFGWWGSSVTFSERQHICSA